jgi:hypothetical protein
MWDPSRLTLVTLLTLLRFNPLFHPLINPLFQPLVSPFMFHLLSYHFTRVSGLFSKRLSTVYKPVPLRQLGFKPDLVFNPSIVASTTLWS